MESANLAISTVGRRVIELLVVYFEGAFLRV